MTNQYPAHTHVEKKSLCGEVPVPFVQGDDVLSFLACVFTCVSISAERFTLNN